MRRSRNFRQGGPRSVWQNSSDNVFFFCLFLDLSLFYRSQMVNFRKSIIFQGSRGGWGPTFSRGGPTFSMGSNCLLPIETHITCDFPGGSGPLSPPSGSALVIQLLHVAKYCQLNIRYCLRLRNTRSIKFVSRTSLIIQKSLSYWLAGLGYNLFAYVTLILYPLIWRLKINST